MNTKKSLKKIKKILKITRKKIEDTFDINRAMSHSPNNPSVVIPLDNYAKKSIEEFDGAFNQQLLQELEKLHDEIMFAAEADDVCIHPSTARAIIYVACLYLQREISEQTLKDLITK